MYNFFLELKQQNESQQQNTLVNPDNIQIMYPYQERIFFN